MYPSRWLKFSAPEIPNDSRVNEPEKRDAYGRARLRSEIGIEENSWIGVEKFP